MYKLTQGWPQHIDSGAFVNPQTNTDYLQWLAEGNTPEPYVAPAPTPLDQIAAIEAANPITHRNLRDLSMTVAQIAAAVTGTDPMVNPAVQQIALLQTTIDALREQARAEGLIP